MCQHILWGYRVRLVYIIKGHCNAVRNGLAARSWLGSSNDAPSKIESNSTRHDCTILARSKTHRVQSLQE